MTVRAPRLHGYRPRVQPDPEKRPCGSRWRKTRLAVLDRFPTCVYCAAEARIEASVVVDHIIAIALGGSSDPDNLIGACAPCNAAKGRAEQAWIANRYPASALEGAAPVRGSLPHYIRTARDTQSKENHD